MKHSESTYFQKQIYTDQMYCVLAYCKYKLRMV